MVHPISRHAPLRLGLPTVVVIVIVFFASSVHLCHLSLILHIVNLLLRGNDKVLVALLTIGLDTSMLHRLLYLITISTSVGINGNGDSEASDLSGECLLGSSALRPSDLRTPEVVARIPMK